MLHSGSAKQSTASSFGNSKSRMSILRPCLFPQMTTRPLCFMYFNCRIKYRAVWPGLGSPGIQYQRYIHDGQSISWPVWLASWRRNCRWDSGASGGEPMMLMHYDYSDNDEMEGKRNGEMRNHWWVTSVHGTVVLVRCVYLHVVLSVWSQNRWSSLCQETSGIWSLSSTRSWRFRNSVVWEDVGMTRDFSSTCYLPAFASSFHVWVDGWTCLIRGRRSSTASCYIQAASWELFAQMRRALYHGERFENSVSSLDGSKWSIYQNKSLASVIEMNDNLSRSLSNPRTCKFLLFLLYNNHLLYQHASLHTYPQKSLPLPHCSSRTIRLIHQIHPAPWKSHPAS